MNKEQPKNKAEWEEKFDECLWDTAIRNQQFKDRGLVKHFIYALLAKAFEGLEVEDKEGESADISNDLWYRDGFNQSNSLWREKINKRKKEMGI